LKPNPYVEVIVDGKPPRKTEICKGTYQPQWTDTITLLVTPYSKVLFRLYDHSAFKKDSLFGEASVELYGILVKHDGRLSRLTMSLDLKSNGNENRCQCP
jgi:atrophin-1 interacting protein 5 (WW domain-containing E3 ubiquitin protein ligase 1)